MWQRLLLHSQYLTKLSPTEYIHLIERFFRVHIPEENKWRQHKTLIISFILVCKTKLFFVIIYPKRLRKIYVTAAWLQCPLPNTSLWTYTYLQIYIKYKYIIHVYTLYIYIKSRYNMLSRPFHHNGFMETSALWEHPHTVHYTHKNSH